MGSSALKSNIIKTCYVELKGHPLTNFVSIFCSTLVATLEIVSWGFFSFLGIKDLGAVN